ncbi:polybromo-1, putative [Ixodes scapularis]|uniref:Polybromo-1, putative n=1 Tax=Ixodes scapularis TaxID=6945 RepID=B7PLL5_IXOSC|nr:polybromo-1, putative [Ixodes scapularis]|eukprot:XP_002434663.1 polybromo-1, putative [Ixodes scapularis]
MLQSLYSALQNCKAEDGHLLCESFLKAPRKRSQVDYHEVVTNPMDMLRIHQKIKTEEYAHVDQMASDVELMVANTKAYYKANSQECKDAEGLWQAFDSARQALLTIRDDDDDDMVSASAQALKSERGSSDEEHYEELFTAVMMATDSEGRCVSSMFQLLPSRVLYPEYYRIISEPVDLKMIATRIQDGSYASLAELEKDLMLLVKNAKTFNEPGSLIYKDATALKKVIRIKKAEIDQRRNAPGKCSERIRLSPLPSALTCRSSRRLQTSQKLSAITAALKYEDADPMEGLGPPPAPSPPAAPSPAVVAASPPPSVGDESDNDSGTEDPVNSPAWQLLEAVRSYQHQGYFLSEPFVKLPSKKLYPDYFREIKQPISLNKIAAKIKTEAYASTMEAVDDLNLLFENAKRYNRPDSKIFKDAVRLQKVMQTKARDLINYQIKVTTSIAVGAQMAALSISRRRGPKKGSPRGRPPLSTPGELKKRLKLLIRSLLNHTDEMGRPLISIFMEKPLRKDYPDYYEIISNPIDMRTIDENVKANRYASEEAMLADLRLMFANCRLYNEEGSQIYRDADTLERALHDKLRELGPLYDSRASRTMPRRSDAPCRNKSRNHKLRVLYDTIKEYTDPKGRKLSTIFMKLPSRAEYPDYYEVIKKPIDMERIATRLLKYNQYDSMDDLLADFVLLFDNACKYNEPDSQIYKDALILQRIALQTKMELSSEDLEDGGVPDVRGLVQELLTNLFISVYNHQDEEGRCYSDSLVELSESDEKSPLSLDLIKRKLDKGCYLRLDRFQEEMFEVFERARRVSRTDSQAFEDSVELQSYFIRLRDELCSQGEVLQSPALNFGQSDLTQNVDAMRAQKLPLEQQEAAAEADAERSSRGSPKEEDKGQEMSSSESTEHRGIVIRVGDFVYVEPREKGMQPHITNVDRLWRDKNGDQWLYGCWFYRPNETFHLASRKFLQKEVFKSDNYNSTPVNQVLGKCYVMPVRDYFKSRPEGFEDKDVYVCESRYSAKAKAFKKIKIWNFFPNEHTELLPREEVLSPIRVPSVFKEGAERTGGGDAFGLGLQDEFAVVERPRPNVSLPAPGDDEGVTYYEQLNLPSGVFKLGDCCYVRTEHSKTLIGRIDKMWMDREGNGFYHGPWFVLPGEIQHPASRVFYRQEVLLSSIEDTNPLLSIMGRCCVLDSKDYSAGRPTEVNEADVYICESRYMEAERQIRKLPKGLKKFSHSDAVTPDEVYYFKNPIAPQKEMSPMLSRIASETDNEESNDVPGSSLAREDSNLSSASGKKVSKLSMEYKSLLLSESAFAGLPSERHPVSPQRSSKRVVTGYLLFSSEIRKSIVQSNPDRSFGDISRLVGNEWRNLQGPQKADYEERALRLSSEDTGDSSLPQSPASSAHGEGSRDGVPPPGGRPVVGPPLIPQQPLHHHFAPPLHPVGTPQLPHGVPQHPHSLPQHPYGSLGQHCPPPWPPGNRGAVPPAVPERTLEPIFVAPPPHPHKLLHTYAYIRYIEQLQPEARHVSPWDAQLKATKENTTVYDPSRLPAHWLGNGVASHGNALNALWALRDFMLRDALGIARIS